MVAAALASTPVTAPCDTNEDQSCRPTEATNAADSSTTSGTSTSLPLTSSSVPQRGVVRKHEDVSRGGPRVESSAAVESVEKCSEVSKND